MTTHPFGRHAAKAAALAMFMALAACTAAPDPAAGAAADAPEFDLLIVGGRVVDGSGSPWFRADVAVKDGRIAAIGALGDRSARERIDAAGRVVSPGFIDMHSHSDLSLLRDGRGLSKIHQGVTTEVIGEGRSVAPRRADADDGQYGITPDWTDLEGYFARLEASGISGNVMSYISAGQLRTVVLGEGVQRRPTDEEMQAMQRLLAEGMEDGAAGLVQALETPGAIQFPPEGEQSLAQPTTAELTALAKVVSRYGGLYATHLRDQGTHIVDAINEAALIGEQGGVPVEIFHLKAAGRPNFGSMPEALAAIRAARARGVDIAADVYPYIAAAHPLSVEVPRWALEGGKDAFLARLADPALRPRIAQAVSDYMNRKYYNELTGAAGFDAVIVSSVPKHPERYVGKTLGEIAREQGKAPDEASLDLLIEQEGSVGIVMYYMSEADVRLAIADPLLSFDSDGTAASPDFGGRPHPRWYGTFPRILGHYVREEQVLGLEAAVRKMSSQPAQRMGLLDRGLVRVGMWADLVVFDPDTVIDQARFDDPHQFPIGIDDVIVNGVGVIRNGEHSGQRPGRALRGPGWRGPQPPE